MKYHRIEDRTDVHELATVARGMRAYAEARDTAPGLADALIRTAETIEAFCTLATRAVVEIEAAIAELSSAFDRNQLH